MKVKELIKELKKVNQEAIVGTPDWLGHCEEIEDVSECEWTSKDKKIQEILLR